MLRLKWMIQFANTQNVTWDYTPVGYWSTLEVHIGILIACLPALRALQHRLFPSSKKNASYYNSPAAAYGYGSRGPNSSLPLGSSIKAKFSRGGGKGDEKDKSFITSTSQASMIRSSRVDHSDTKNFIPLEEYEVRLDSHAHTPTEAHAKETGRGRRSSSSNGNNGTFLDSSSVTNLRPTPGAGTTPPKASPAASGFGMGPMTVHVKKEYSVNVEHIDGSSPPSTAKGGSTVVNSPERNAGKMGRRSDYGR